MIRPLLVLALILGCVALATPDAASAQASVDQELSAIREQIFQAQFNDAIQAASVLLERPLLTAAQRNAALEVLATAQIANRDHGAARETLAELYARDPGHRLTDPDAGPPVIAAFARARERAPAPLPVNIEHQPPTLSQRESPEIVARVTEGADAVAELRLIHQTDGGEPGRVVMSPHRDGTFVGRIPVVGADSEPSQVSYHLVALAPSQTPLGQLGSSDEPMRVTIPAGQLASSGTDIEHERPPVLQGERPSQSASSQGGPIDDGGDNGGGVNVAEEWWFWTLIGLVVVGGAVTAGVLVATQSGPQVGSLGTGRLSVIEF